MNARIHDIHKILLEGSDSGFQGSEMVDDIKLLRQRRPGCFLSFNSASFHGVEGQLPIPDELFYTRTNTNG